MRNNKGDEKKQDNPESVMEITLKIWKYLACATRSPTGRG
jgi:hypothetical protein